MKIKVRSQKSEVGRQKLFYLLPIAYCLLPFIVFAEEAPTLQEVIKKPKVHIVREGDTLWDLSGKYLNNPFKWQNIHDSNKFIVNPDLIYPGDNIVIPELFDEVVIEREASLKAEPQLAPQVEPEPDEEAIPELTVVTLLPPPPPPPPQPEKVPLTSLQTLTAAGYIISQEKEKGIIYDSPEPRTIFGSGDTVYINTGEKEGLKEGDRFTVYKPLRMVTHPVTGEDVGVLIETLGELEIKEVRHDSSTAYITESYSAIELGNKLKEREDITIPMIDPAAKAEMKDITGYIIDTKDQRDTVASGDIVYIDAGKDKGVSEGDKFIIFKSGEKRKGEIKLPKVIIGSLQVIASREKTSTAIITESKKEITVGEMIEYQK
jgi:hypothetical protein